MYVINLYGGPGTGKSTMAAGLYHLMKMKGYDVELVTEFAKDLAWEGRLSSDLIDQGYIFAQQNRKLYRLQNQVEYVITDSPLLLNLIYCPVNYVPRQEFEDYVIATHKSYNSVNYFIRRGQTPYRTVGRVQTFDQAVQLDGMIFEMVDAVTSLTVVDRSVYQILGQLKRDVPGCG